VENKWESLIRGMEAKGLRITTQRRLVAKVFASSKGFVLPRDVYSYISDYIPGLSYDTVYRNLRLLTEIGLIEQFNYMEGVRFKLKSGASRYAYYFICVKCQQTYPLDFHLRDYNIEIPDDFEIVSQKLEINGLCGSCKNQS